MCAAVVVLTRNVRRRGYRDHTSHGLERCKIERADTTVRDVAEPKGRVQCIGGQRDIIRVQCSARDMQMRAVVGLRSADQIMSFRFCDRHSPSPLPAMRPSYAAAAWCRCAPGKTDAAGWPQPLTDTRYCCADPSGAENP